MATDPNTGLPDWLSAITNVGSALAGASEGRAQGRLAEGNANINQNNAAINLYRAQLAAPSQIAHNAVKGDVLSRAQDATFSGVPSDIPVPTISGGLRPSMFSPETRATGVGVTNNALASAAALQPVQTPVLPNLPQAGGLDSFLNSASGISGALKAFGGDGAGSSFKFGGNDIAGGVKNLLTGHGWNAGGESTNPNGLPTGPWEPGDPNSPFYTQGKTYGPNEPNWPELPAWLKQNAGGTDAGNWSDFGDTSS